MLPIPLTQTHPRCDKHSSEFIVVYLALFFRVVLSILVGGSVLGQLSAISPDYEKAKIAAARLFKIFDRKSAIDSSSEDGLKPVRIYSPALYFVNV